MTSERRWKRGCALALPAVLLLVSAAKSHALEIREIASKRQAAIERVAAELLKPLIGGTRQAGPKVVAIAPLDVAEDRRSIAIYSEDLLANALFSVGGGKIKVVSCRYRDKVLDELAWNAKVVTEAGAIKYGKQIAAQYLVTGNIMVTDRIELTAHLIKVESGEKLSGGETAYDLETDIIEKLRILKMGKNLTVELPVDKFVGGDGADTLASIGDLYYRCGKTKKAENEYKKIMQNPKLSNERKARIAARLAYLAHTRRELAEAESLYKQAVELDPAYEAAKSHLTVLTLQKNTIGIAKRRYGNEYGARTEKLVSLWLGQQRQVERLSKELFFGLELVALNDDKGAYTTAPLQQGGVLYSAKSKFKIVFRTSHPVCVYIWNMDTTGKIWPVWPRVPAGDSTSWRSGPVLQNKTYEVPPKDKWFILDRNTGKEFFFYLVSVKPLRELDRLMVYFARNRNPEVMENLKPRYEPAVVKNIRGLSLRTRGIAGEITVSGPDADAPPLKFTMNEYALTGTETAGVIWFDHKNTEKQAGAQRQ